MTITNNTTTKPPSSPPTIGNMTPSLLESSNMLFLFVGVWSFVGRTEHISPV